MPKSDKKTPKEAGDVLALDSRQNDQKMDEDGAEEQLPLHERKGVVYIGHIPHGFYEKQMKEYFKQFGAMKRMVLARSRKTGNSKGYAFCQFEDETVAKVVAETMNGYPIMEKVLVAALVPAEKVHSAMFRYADRKWKKIPWRKVIREKQLEPKTDEQAEKKMRKLLTRERQEAAKLSAAGVDYDFPTSYMGLATSVGLIEEEDSEDEIAAAPAKAVKDGSKGVTAATAPASTGKGKGKGQGQEAPLQQKVAPAPSVGQKRKRSEDETESKPAAPSKPAPVAAPIPPSVPSSSSHKAAATAGGKGAKEAQPAAKGGKAAAVVKPQAEDSEEEDDDEEYEFARDDDEQEDEEEVAPAQKKGKATATTAAAAAGKEKKRVSFGKNQVALLPPIAKVKEAIAAAQVRQQAQAQAGTGTQVKGVLKQPKAAPQASAAGSAAAAKTSKAKTAATRPLLHNKK